MIDDLQFGLFVLIMSVCVSVVTFIFTIDAKGVFEAIQGFAESHTLIQWALLGAAVGMAGVLMKTDKPTWQRMAAHGIAGATFGVVGGKFAAGMGANESLQMVGAAAGSHGGPKTLDGVIGQLAKGGRE